MNFICLTLLGREIDSLDRKKLIAYLYARFLRKLKQFKWKCKKDKVKLHDHALCTIEE